MDRAALMKWSAGYAAVWILSTAVGLAIAGYGALEWALPAYSLYAGGAPTAVALRTAAPGIALILVGTLAWQVGSTAALYWTLTAAFAVETGEQLDTEAMKSDILSVMDERLADMHEDVRQARRLVERERRADAAEEFEFSGNQ